MEIPFINISLSVTEKKTAFSRKFRKYENKRSYKEYICNLYRKFSLSLLYITITFKLKKIAFQEINLDFK